MKRFSSQPEIPPDFSGRIRRLRERFGLNRAQLSGLPGITASSVALTVMNRSQPSFERWQHIPQADQLDLDSPGEKQMASCTDLIADRILQ